MKEARIAISKLVINETDFDGLLGFEAKKLFDQLPNANQIVLIAQDWTDETTEDNKMTLRDANLQPGDKLEIRRHGLEVKAVNANTVVMTNGLHYTLDKEDFIAENIVRAPKYPDFWPPQEGDVWASPLGDSNPYYYPYAGGKFHSTRWFGMMFDMNDMGNTERLKLVFRIGVTDKDYEVMTQRNIDQSKLINEQSKTISSLREELEEVRLDKEELEDDVAYFQNVARDHKDALVVAKSVAKDARKEADSYERQLKAAALGTEWEFKFDYTHGGYSEWCSVREQTIDWTDLVNPPHSSIRPSIIQKVSFRKAKP